LTEETAVVSIMVANNETGVVFPIEAIGEIVKAKGIPLHVDAVQVAGKIPLDLNRSPVDLATISAHKFHGPKGVGALYVRRGITFRPFIIGGHQERSRRGGTENVAGIVGMGKAAAIALRCLDEEREKVRALRDQLEQSLLASCPTCRINGHREKRIPNTLNVSFQFLEGEAILVLLDQHGICASTGSACTAGSTEPSHVLGAMGLEPDWIQGAVRFSLSRYNTEQEVRFVAEKMPLIVQRLQGLSALGKLAGEQGRGQGRSAARERVGARR
jgi:cysteine desulfurase